MKIIFSIKALNNSGGTERVLAVISDAFVRQGHDVEIISFVGGGGKPFFKFNDSIRIHYLCDGPRPASKWRLTKKRIEAMRKIYGASNPDVIIVVDAGRSFVNVPAARGYKMITWEHFNTHINWHLFHKRSRKLAVKASDLIVTLTWRDADAYRKEFGAKNVTCIYNPITIDNSESSPLTENQVISIGRLCSQKRPDILLKAWALTDGRNNGWKLKLMGSGSRKWESKLRSLVGTLGIEDSVIFAKPHPEVETEMKQSSIYAMASDFEGLPLVLIEALSMGLPQVSTDCYTGPSEIIDNGETGYLVGCGDIKALAARLDELMGDEALRRKFSLAALESAKKKFSLEKILEDWSSVLKSFE